MNLPVEVIEAVRAGRCALVVGSNATREAVELAGGQYPEGADLARQLGWQRPKVMPGARPKPVMPSVTGGAAALEAKLGRAGLVATLGLKVGARDVPPSEAHHAAWRRFNAVFTTCWDELLEAAAGPDLDLRGWGDEVPQPSVDHRVLYRLRGRLSDPSSLILTDADRAARTFSDDFKSQIRTLVRRYVLFFVGFRPDEEEFEQLWEDLTVCYGGELPRCHLAVSQGTIDDYQWQRWVWRGLLLFHADPVECMTELERHLGARP